MTSPSLPYCFGALPPERCDLTRARVVILPVPYDATASYRAGARRGPEAIIDASRYMELFDEEEHSDFSEVGIATLEPLCPVARGPESMLQLVQAEAARIVERGQFLLTLGGEHSVTLGAVQAIAKSNKNVGVLQLDAHLDLRDSYEGTHYSHACVMRRIRDDLGLETVQVGIRSFSEEEHAYAEDKELRFFPARDLVEASAVRRDRIIDAIVQSLPEQIYLTIDLDVFDPAALPATGTPEPGGLGWYTVVELIRRVCSAREVVAADIVELAPIPGQPASDFLAAKLAYKLIGYAVALERRWVWKTDPESKVDKLKKKAAPASDDGPTTPSRPAAATSDGDDDALEDAPTTPGNPTKPTRS